MTTNIVHETVIHGHAMNRIVRIMITMPLCYFYTTGYKQLDPSTPIVIFFRKCRLKGYYLIKHINKCSLLATLSFIKLIKR